MLRLQRRGVLPLLHVTRQKTVPPTAGADLRGSPGPLRTRFGVQICLFFLVECLKSNAKNLPAGMIRVRSHIRRAPSPTTRCACASSGHTAENGSPDGRSRSPRVSGTLWDAFGEMSGIGLVYFVDPPGLNSKSRNLPVVDPFLGSAAVAVGPGMYCFAWRGPGVAYAAYMQHNDHNTVIELRQWIGIMAQAGATRSSETKQSRLLWTQVKLVPATPTGWLPSLRRLLQGREIST